MGRALRNRDPEIYRFLSIKTTRGEMWITPNSRVRRVIGGIIARYQEIHNIELYGVEALSNHMHMIARAPSSNIDEFCQDVNREMARRINFIHGREGSLWNRRYTDQEILSEEDLLEAFLYLHTNPSHHGLVEDSSTWPGFNTYNQVLTERDSQFSFYHYSAKENEEKVTKHTLKISVLPQFRELSRSKRRKLIEQLLKTRQMEIAEKRLEQRKPFLGLAGVRATEAGAVPRKMTRSPCPPCYSKSPSLIREFREQYRELRSRYDLASYYYRLRQSCFDFPEHTFLPPMHRFPKTPMNMEDGTIAKKIF